MLLCHRAILPLTSIVEFAFGAMLNVYTHIYSPESSARGLLILQQNKKQFSTQHCR